MIKGPKPARSFPVNSATTSSVAVAATHTENTTRAVASLFGDVRFVVKSQFWVSEYLRLLWFDLGGKRALSLARVKPPATV